MLVVSIAGSPSIRSHSEVLLGHTKDWLDRRGVEVISHQVLGFPAEDSLRARLDSLPVLALVEQIGRADGLLVATPVYRASFSDALKTLLDLLPEHTLKHKAVLPFTAGNSGARMLTMGYVLEPILAALKTQEVPHGVLAVGKQIAYVTENGPVRLESIPE